MSSLMARRPIATTRLNEVISKVMVQANHQTKGEGRCRKSQSAAVKNGGMAQSRARRRSEVSPPNRAGNSQGFSHAANRILVATATASPSAARERDVDRFAIVGSAERRTRLPNSRQFGWPQSSPAQRYWRLGRHTYRHDGRQSERGERQKCAESAQDKSNDLPSPTFSSLHESRSRDQARGRNHE